MTSDRCPCTARRGPCGVMFNFGEDARNLRRKKHMSIKPKKASPRYPTPALEKGLDILELFAREPVGLTKSDVAASSAAPCRRSFA